MLGRLGGHSDRRAALAPEVPGGFCSPVASDVDGDTFPGPQVSSWLESFHPVAIPLARCLMPAYREELSSLRLRDYVEARWEDGAHTREGGGGRRAALSQEASARMDCHAPGAWGLQREKWGWCFEHGGLWPRGVASNSPEEEALVLWARLVGPEGRLGMQSHTIQSHQGARAAAP
ncbi:hypothetical protein H8959_006590 [Pygathrix nigripes]